METERGSGGAVSGAKQVVTAAVDEVLDELVGLSRRIHANPELGFREELASGWCAEMLDAGGLSVQTGVCDLPTAFTASAGSGPLHVAICAEYDALPGIGHACGHNLIAAAAVGAGIALARVADDAGLHVSVIGTPAEEGGGGKILMLERGGFDGVDAAMMVHPAPLELDRIPCLAVSTHQVHFHGKEAHASAFPEFGVNASDAFTVAQVAIGLLRQHLPSHVRVHGIVTHGGDAANVVPARTEGTWMLRARTLAEVEELLPKMLRCFEAGALATGATVEIQALGPPYSEFRPHEGMVALYRSNAEGLGRAFPDLPVEAERVAGSTDMANVSLRIPSIHPMIGIDSLPAINHQPEFAQHCITEVAHRAMRDGAVAMAQTALDLAAEPSVLASSP